MDKRPTLELRGVAGKPVHLELEAVPGAGVMWIAPAPPANCQLAEGERRAMDGGVGGAVKQHFEFTAARPGRYVLEFAYKRRWETEVRAAQPVRIDVE